MQEDFEDEAKACEKDSMVKKGNDERNIEPKSEVVESATNENKVSVSDSTILDLLDISTNEPSETDCLLDIFNNAANTCKTSAPSSSSSNLLAFDFLKKIHGSTAASPSSGTTAAASATEATKKGVNNKSKASDKKASAWMDLFADLDPLANPTAMEQKIAGSNQNCLDA